MSESPQILFVDDSRTARKMAHKILQDKYRVYTCESGEEAWDMLRTSTSVRIVFTDINMQGMSGLQLLTNIRESSNSRIATMPVIMITGAADTETAMREAFEMGATDFIAKPFKNMDLMSRAYSYIKLSERVSSLEEQLGIDKLSGLYNATSMQQHAVKFLAFAQRHHTQFSIALIEIMNFENILDEHGNKIAGQIITTIAERFKSKVRNEDVVARIGAAQFAILQPVCNQIRAQAGIRRVRTDVHNINFRIGAQSLRLSLAVGLTTSQNNNMKQTVEDMMTEARHALSNARQMNRDFFAIFEHNTGDNNEEDNINNLVDSLRHVIEGSYDHINPAHLPELNQRLNRFLDYQRSIQQDPFSASS